MDIVQIKIADQLIEVACNDGEKAQDLANKVNKIFQEISSSTVDSTSLKSMFLVSILLQDKIDNLEHKLNNLEKIDINSNKKKKRASINTAKDDNDDTNYDSYNNYDDILDENLDPLVAKDRENEQLKELVIYMLDCINNSTITLEKSHNK